MGCVLYWFVLWVLLVLFAFSCCLLVCGWFAACWLGYVVRFPVLCCGLLLWFGCLVLFVCLLFCLCGLLRFDLFFGLVWSLCALRLLVLIAWFRLFSS